MCSVLLTYFGFFISALKPDVSLVAFSQRAGRPATFHTTTCRQACYVSHNNLSIGLLRFAQQPVSMPTTFHTTSCQQPCYVLHNLPVGLLHFTQPASRPVTLHTTTCQYTCYISHISGHSFLSLLPYHCVSYGVSLRSAIVSVTACPLFLTVVSVTACLFTLLLCQLQLVPSF